MTKLQREGQVHMLTHSTRRRKPLTLIAALGAWLVVVLMSTTLGAVRIPPTAIAAIIANQLGLSLPVTWPAEYETVVLYLRLPRVILSSLVGAALALAGVTFQGLLRNPLADPYILGVSSGASLGAVLAISLGVGGSLLGFNGVALAAFVGALAAMTLVLLLGRKGQRMPVPTLLLAGVAVSSFLSSLVSLVILFSEKHLGSFLFWLMGGLGSADWRTVAAMLPYLVVASATLGWHARSLNALAFGEESAGHLGVDVERVKVTLVLAASLITASAVASSGVIGFVGLITPHIVRLVKGPDHRGLVPLVMVVGATFLVIADTLARTVLAPQELPVGAITALCGAPFFVHLLRHYGERR